MEVKTFWLAIYFVSLNLISTISNAQYNDAGLWVGFNLEKKNYQNNLSFIYTGIKNE